MFIVGEPYSELLGTWMFNWTRTTEHSEDSESDDFGDKASLFTDSPVYTISLYDLQVLITIKSCAWSNCFKVYHVHF